VATSNFVVIAGLTRNPMTEGALLQEIAGQARNDSTFFDKLSMTIDIKMYNLYLSQFLTTIC
jgi:hypothetical protein